MALKLRALERFRWQALRNSLLIICIGGLLLAGGAFLLLAYEAPYSWDDLPAWTILFVLLGLMVVGALASGSIDTFKDTFLTAFFKEMGESLSYNPMPETEDLDPNLFYELGLVDHYRSASLANMISGVRDGHTFSWMRTELTAHTGGTAQTVSRTTVFIGVLMRIQDVVPVPHTVRIMPRQGKIGDFMKRRKGLQKVQVDHDTFSSLHSVYSQTPQEARALITPQFIEKFSLLKEVFHKEKIFDTKSIEAAFHQKDLLLAIHFASFKGDKFLETPSVFRPLAKQKGVIDRLFAQVRFIEEVIIQGTSLSSP